MTLVLTHIKLYWPIFTSATGLLIAILVVVRYKLPDLTRRIEAVEKKGANSTDLDRAIDGFQTVCKFNQVSCQKENQHAWAKLIKEYDKKLGDLYEKLNALQVANANLVAKVEILIEERAIKAVNKI